MADVKTVAIRLKAINDDYRKGMSEAGDSTLTMSKVSVAAIAAVGVTAAAMALKAADATVDYGKSIMRLARISGESTDTMSKLNFAAQQSGVSTDTLGNGIKFLEKSMGSANPEFAKLGVSVVDSSGKLRGTHAVLLDTADAISKMTNGAERSSATLKIFGRAGLELGPLLNKGRQGIVDLENQAQKYGLVLSKDNISAIQANVKAHRELDAAMMGAKIQIGTQMLPALTTLTEMYARLPGPIASAVVPVAGLSAGLLVAATVAPQVAASFALIAPAVRSAATAMTANGTLMGDSMAVGAAIGIAVILKGLHDIQEESQRLQQELSGGIDWSNYAKAASGLNAETAKVNQLGEAWNRMSAAEKLMNPGAWKTYNDLAAQQEEDAKHFAETTNRIQSLGRALGVSGAEAQKLADKVGIDLVGVDPAKYERVFKQLAAGQISASDATSILTRAIEEQAGGADLAADKIKALKDEVKEQNDAERASIEPQTAAVEARQRNIAAQEKVRSAERGLVDAHRAVADASDRVRDAEQRRTDAARKITDAVNAQRDAQRALNDLMRGPTADEQVGVESARLSLEEAQRRAKGITTADPGLEKRRNELDVRRAQLDLQRAEGAHADNVRTAQDRLADATRAVIDARAAAADADRGVADARRGVEDATNKVAGAEDALRQANFDTTKTALDLDQANRNLNLAYAVGEVSIDQSVEALKRWVTQGLLSQAQADSMAESWRQAKKAADEANPAAGPPPATVDPFGLGVAIATNVDPFGVGAGIAQGHATGGMLGEGWNLVGEQGPELVSKSGANAWVKTAPASRGLLTPHAAMAAAANWQPQAAQGGYHHHGDIIVGGGTERTAHDIAWEQRRLALAMVGPS